MNDQVLVVFSSEEVIGDESKTSLVKAAPNLFNETWMQVVDNPVSAEVWKSAALGNESESLRFPSTNSTLG